MVDRPSKPEGPLEVHDVFKDRCRLSWKPPKDDGGVEIEHYEVEAMDTSTGTIHCKPTQSKPKLNLKTMITCFLKESGWRWERSKVTRSSG